MHSLKHIDALALVLSPTFIFVLLFNFLGYDGFYGQDAYAYLEYARAIKLEGPATLFSHSFFWPKMYPGIGGVLGWFGLPLEVIMSLLSTLSLGFAVLFIRNILLLKNIAKNVANIAVLLIVLMSPYLLRSGLSAMSDAMMVLGVSAIFYIHYKQLKSPSVMRFIYMAIASLLVFNVRYVSLIICLPILIYWGLFMLKNKQYGMLLLFGLIACIPVVQFVTFDSRGLSQHGFIQNWDMANWFTSSFDGGERPFEYSTANIVHGLRSFIHFGYSFLGLPMILICVLKKLKIDYLLMSTGLIYIAFLAGIPFQNDRFLIIMPLIVVLSFSDALKWIAKVKLKPIIKMSGVLLGILFSLVLIYMAMKTPLKTNKTERTLSSYLDEKPYERIISFEVDVALKSRLDGVSVHSLWQLDTDISYSNAVLVINEKSLIDNWKETRVMDALNYLNTHYSVTLADSLMSDWKVFKIE